MIQDMAIVTMEFEYPSFQWYYPKWPWVTSNLDFKDTILFNVK